MLYSFVSADRRATARTTTSLSHAAIRQKKRRAPIQCGHANLTSMLWSGYTHKPKKLAVRNAEWNIIKVVAHCMDPKMMISAPDGSSTEQDLNQSRHIGWTTTVHLYPQRHQHLFRRRRCIQLFLFGSLFRLAPGRFLGSEEHINVRCADSQRFLSSWMW